MTKDPHVNVSNTSFQNYVNLVNYESTNVDTGLMQDSIDAEFVEEKVDSYYTEATITYNSEEEVQIQNIEEGQILEESMLEEETEFQGIDKCKIVELPDKQEIERCIDRETVASPEMPVRIACEQEECIEGEICDRS